MKKIMTKLIQFLRLKQLIENANIIGSTVAVGKGSEIVGSKISGSVTIGDGCRIRHVDISGIVEIGNNTSIWGPNITIRSALNAVKIGNYCSIAKDVNFQEYNHNHEDFTTYFIEQNILRSNNHKKEIVSKGAIEVGHDVWIGSGAIILSGAQIGTGAVIAANSVVNGTIPPYAIAGGTPAKVIKYRFSEDIINSLLKTEWWMLDAQALKAQIPALRQIVNK